MVIVMDNFQVGDIITGVVTGVESYGIFLSFGENSCGLIHISEISDSFVKDVNDYAKVNQTMQAKILSIDPSGHCKLSLKAMEEHPKVSSNHIIETKTGFQTLKEKLPEWVEEAYSETEKM